MPQKRSILYLNDPLSKYPNTKGLVFHENESILSQAQAALWQLRRDAGWVCVAAQGAAADIGLALAAQLPVDRLALLNMPRGRAKLPRQMNKLRAFARRNLALITAEILIIGADEAQVQALLRGTGRCRICALDSLPMELLTVPWEQICGAERAICIR